LGKICPFDHRQPESTASSTGGGVRRALLPGATPARAKQHGEMRFHRARASPARGHNSTAAWQRALLEGGPANNLTRAGVCREGEFCQGELSFEGSAGSASPSRVE
jgi:hypothetical protein